MKRLINIRPLLLAAVSFAVGIFACYKLLSGNFYFGFVVLILLVIGVVVSAILRHGVAKTLTVCLVFVLLGSFFTGLSYLRLTNDEIVDQTVTLRGRVCDLGRNSGEDQSYVYFLEDCVDVSSGAKYSGRVKLVYYSFDGRMLQTGDSVTVKGTLNSVYPIQRTVKSQLIRNNIRYEVSSATLLYSQSGELKFGEKARSYVYDLTQKYMPSGGGIMYALLTGDRNALSDEVENAFTRSGIVHLLAVSGLHVGFIVAILCFLLKRFHFHPLIEGALVLLPLTLYAYICNFSPSVVRAIVMTMCSYVTRAFWGKYDLLTSLSLAMLLILSVQPFYLFDAGFQLSFLSVYGIATLRSSIDRLFRRKKINVLLRWLVNGVVTSTACTVATLFTVATNFGEVPILGVLVNIVAIPLVTLTFVLGIIGLLPWVFHYILIGADKILFALIWLAKNISSWDFAAVSVAAISISSVVVVVMLFVVGGFVNVKRRGKAVVYSVCALMLVVCVTVAAVPVNPANEVRVCFGYDDTVTVAFSSDKEVAIIADFSDYYAMSSAMRYASKYKVEECTLYIAHYGNAQSEVLNLVTCTLQVNKVYVLNTEGNDEMDKYFAENNIARIYQYPNSPVGRSISVQTLYNAGLCAVNVDVGEVNVCILFDTDYVSDILNVARGADVYVTERVNEQFADANVTTLSFYQSSIGSNYGANKYGNFTIKQKGDKITLSKG